MKKLFILAAAVIMSVSAYAQQALWGGVNVVSPEIHPDKTVTFRIAAPTVSTVQLTGDFLPTVPTETPYGTFDMPGVVDMAKGENGIWNYTTPQPLEPELYSYTLIVDGFGTVDPGNIHIKRDVASLTNYFIVDGGIADLYKTNNVPHGTVARLWYDSPTLGMQRRMTVYTPPGYEDSGKRTYPVFYLNHGAGGDEEAWIALGRTAQILDNLIAKGKAVPMIVVMTNGNAGEEAAPGEGSDGLVKPGMMQRGMMAGQFEASFPDVVNYIDKHYRTIAKKEGRAIGGLSMGGFHSLHISKEYPDMFDYVGLFSAAIMPGQNTEAKAYQNFDEKLKVQFSKKPKLYWIAIGKTDFLYQANLDYIKILEERGYPYIYRESEGGHIWKNWRIYLTEFAPMLFK